MPRLRGSSGGNDLYGTIARVKLLPGKEQEFRDHLNTYRDLGVDGFVAEALYRADSGSDEYWMAVIFESAEKYRANADSPEQDARFQKLAALMAAEPEWHDGEIVYEFRK